MLVLSRSPDERILLKVPGLDQEIEVLVVRIQGSTVRLGFTAPPNVSILRAEVCNSRAPPVSAAAIGESSIQTAQPGDRVQVHYVKRFQDGSVASSRGRAPLELTVGIDHSRLPGLGKALVGLAPGTSITVRVPSERAYGLSDPARVHRWARTRFPKDQSLVIGKWVLILNHQGQRRLVRILAVRGRMVIVDTNHRWAGQAMELEVELIGIQAAPDAGVSLREP
jgi:carbon storage regulator CsrA